MEQVKLIVIGIILIIQSVCDIKWKKIPLLVTGIGGFFGMVFIWMKPETLSEVLFALFPGVLCLLFARVSRQAIGYGDALLLCMMGFFYKPEEIFRLLFTAFGLAGIAALFFVVVCRKKRKYEMAFVPFLAVSYMADIWIRIQGGYL